MAGYENGQFQNAGIPSLEMLIENGKTKAKLNNTVDAKKDFETAIQYYPEDYRAYYELLKIISNNFTKPHSFYGRSIEDNYEFKKCYSALLAMDIPDYMHIDILRYQIGVSNKPEKVSSDVDGVYFKINELLEQSKLLIDKNSSSVVNYDKNIQARKQEIIDKQNSKDEKSEKGDGTFEKIMAIISFIFAGFFLISSFVTISAKVLTILTIILVIIFAVIGVILGGFIGFLIADVLFAGIGFVLSALYPTTNGKYVLVAIFAGLGFLFVWIQQKNRAAKYMERHEKQLEDDKKIRDAERQIENDISLKDYNIENHHKQIRHNQEVIEKINNLKNRLDLLLQDNDIWDNYKLKHICKDHKITYNYTNDEFEEIKKEVFDIYSKEEEIWKQNDNLL